jgi:hypothetical protein
MNDALPVSTAAVDKNTVALPNWSREARLWDREWLAKGAEFRTTDGRKYTVTGNGAFIRPNKDVRSPKERKRARQALRES